MIHPMDGALMLAGLGIEVAPAFGLLVSGSCACRNPHCRCPGKHPLLYDDRTRGTTDLLEILEWWAKYRTANVLAHTGVRSRVFVLDVDGVEGFRSLEHLQEEHGGLPATFTVRSGSGGAHLYFAIPADGPLLPSAGAVFGPGLDARGEGGWVIGPGSLHRSGGVYEVIDDRLLAPAPVWLTDLALRYERGT